MAEVVVAPGWFDEHFSPDYPFAELEDEMDAQRTKLEQDAEDAFDNYLLANLPSPPQKTRQWPIKTPPPSISWKPTPIATLGAFMKQDAKETGSVLLRMNVGENEQLIKSLGLAVDPESHSIVYLPFGWTATQDEQTDTNVCLILVDGDGTKRARFDVKTRLLKE